jgi:hypothetical protein
MHQEDVCQVHRQHQPGLLEEHVDARLAGVVRVLCTRLQWVSRRLRRWTARILRQGVRQHTAVQTVARSGKQRDCRSNADGQRWRGCRDELVLVHCRRRDWRRSAAGCGCGNLCGIVQKVKELSHLKPTTTLMLATLSFLVTLFVSASVGQSLDKCDLLYTECWKQCGRPAYFPFTCTVDPNSLFNAIQAQVVTSCQGPIECPACMALGTTCTKKTCSKCTDANNPSIWKNSLIPGSLTWCECCALNCNGFRADCVAGPQGFCTKACANTLQCHPAQAPANQVGSTTTPLATTPLPTPPVAALPTPAPSPKPTPLPTPSPSPAPTPLPTPLAPAAAGSNDGSTGAVCARFSADWFTDYAPGRFDDTNWNAPQSITTGDAFASCAPGTVKPLFLNDATTRLNFYRWLVGLQAANVSPTNQIKSQKCALMMARSQNTGSPQYVESIDPHTVHTGFTCQDADAREAAQFGNIYNGQSVPGLDYLWQTTPAHVLAGFVVDTSSFKVGHRQNVLCPNLADTSFGHVCFLEPTTTRYLCGGCQMVYGAQRQRPAGRAAGQPERLRRLPAARRRAVGRAAEHAVGLLVVRDARAARRPLQCLHRPDQRAAARRRPSACRRSAPAAACRATRPARRWSGFASARRRSATPSASRTRSSCAPPATASSSGPTRCARSTAPRSRRRRPRPPCRCR